MRLPLSCPALLAIAFAATVVAHPIPDVPVRGAFEADGNFTLRVEVDVRCLEADPEAENYLMHIQMTKLMTPAECEDLKKQAQAFVDRGVEFFFEPQGPFKPNLKWEFTALGGGPLVNIDDPVMVTGTWRSKLPDGAQGYSIRAKDPRNLAVVFENSLNGRPVERTAVLFPGEKSFTLELNGSNAATSSGPPEVTKEPPRPQASAGMPWIRGVALLGAVMAALWLFRLSRA